MLGGFSLAAHEGSQGRRGCYFCRFTLASAKRREQRPVTDTDANIKLLRGTYATQLATLLVYLPLWGAVLSKLLT